MVWQYGLGRLAISTNPRAQRLAASVVWQVLSEVAILPAAECSTPCGISGLAEAILLPGLFRKLSVLNALRHQWFGRTGKHRDPLDKFKCSTPCGISGLAA